MIRKFLKFVYTKWLIIKNLKKGKISFNTKISSETCFEGFNKISKCNLVSSKIGFASCVGNAVVLPHTKIGKFCSIGKEVKVVWWSHPIDKLSTFCGFYKSFSKVPFVSRNNNYKHNEILKTKNGFYCEIGNDVWIGDNVIIKGGITIGNGAVIGMGSVVTKNVPPYAVIGGSPAKIIKFRFDEQTVQRLEKLQWWNMPLDILKGIDLSNDLIIDELEKIKSK